MTDNVTNELLLEHLKAVRAELAAARKRDEEILHRLRFVDKAVTSISIERQLDLND